MRTTKSRHSTQKPHEPLARRSTPGRASWLLRLRVALNSLNVDQQLAFGFPASWSAQLELRAVQLASASRRESFARTLHTIVGRAHGAERARRDDRWSNKVPVARAAVLDCEDAMRELADALTDPSCTNLRGVALTSCLLEDPTSSLYSGASLGDALREATAALRDEGTPPSRATETL